MAYTALVYSYWASFHDAYGCLRHTHYRYRLQLPYKSHRTYLTNHMGSTYIMPHHATSYLLPRGRTHTHTHTSKYTHAYRHLRTETILRNQARFGLWPAHAWFKNMFRTPKFCESAPSIRLHRMQCF